MLVLMLRPLLQLLALVLPSQLLQEQMSQPKIALYCLEACPVSQNRLPFKWGYDPWQMPGLRKICLFAALHRNFQTFARNKDCEDSIA
mmetsp:Transcript_64510/g.140452  ORF Transcript_64510/g.140452 Transcript_64510/m.140452 type:complete len:88 (-) Transcript_64510:215-478(-)